MIQFKSAAVSGALVYLVHNFFIERPGETCYDSKINPEMR